LLGGDAALLEQGNLEAATREIVACEHAYDAAADDDDVRFTRKGWTGFDMQERRAHPTGISDGRRSVTEDLRQPPADFRRETEYPAVYCL